MKKKSNKKLRNEPIPLNELMMNILNFLFILNQNIEGFSKIQIYEYKIKIKYKINEIN